MCAADHVGHPECSQNCALYNCPMEFNTADPDCDYFNCANAVADICMFGLPAVLQKHEVIEPGTDS